jgi:hypothetical protein
MLLAPRRERRFLHKALRAAQALCPLAFGSVSVRLSHKGCRLGEQAQFGHPVAREWKGPSNFEKTPNEAGMLLKTKDRDEKDCQTKPECS